MMSDRRTKSDTSLQSSLSFSSLSIDMSGNIAEGIPSSSIGPTKQPNDLEKMTKFPESTSEDCSSTFASCTRSMAKTSLLLAMIIGLFVFIAGWGWGCFFRTVRPDETAVAHSKKRAVIATIFAYNWRIDRNWSADQFERPIYKHSTWDREKPQFWNYMVDELLLSKIPLVLLHGRGCLDPHNSSDTRSASGNMCPRLLSKFVEAVERADASDSIRVGMWDDTGFYFRARQTILNTTGLFDMSDTNNWRFFWDYNIKIFFDTVPKKLWYLWDGKPVIASWTLSSDFFSNQRYHASKMLSWIKHQFYREYGLEPMFILDDSWLWQDHTITPDTAEGAFAWFRPPYESYRIIDYNGGSWAAGVPSFRDPHTSPGCGEDCREITRDNGDVANVLLSNGRSSEFIMLEGWTNMVEAGGFYRSSNWTYPTQYINLVREHSDPEPEMLKFEAEGADFFYDTSEQNIGGEYSDRSLDVGALPNHTGWYVGWIEPGEWLEYTQVKLGCGTYRFTARVATTREGTSLHLEIDGISPVSLPNTLTEYRELNIGEIEIPAGKHDFRITFLSSGIALDWYRLEKINDRCGGRRLRQP